MIKSHYDILFWTDCFNNEYKTHCSNKDTFSWFLKSLRKVFTAIKREVFINLKKAKRHINEYCILNNYYNSDINVLKLVSETDKQEVTDFKESDKFIKKINAEKSHIKKEVWIRTYKEVLNMLNVNKKSNYKKRVKKLKNQIHYIIWDSFT